jgi:peptidoglycan/xylan/chitin deacetylase (PgdA/CDA1 family)
VGRRWRALWWGCLLLGLALLPSRDYLATGPGTPILVYHRFSPSAADSMTVRTSVFEEQLQHLRQHDYVVIPLRRLVAHLRGALPPPLRSVVLTVDDAHRSVYEEALPLIRRYGIPLTLFVYPSAVSNADYAMTWEQLRELTATGLVEVQSHTYWHPNFAREKKRLSPDAYKHFVQDQLRRSRATLESRLGNPVDLLAWPFGSFDAELMRAASEAGYLAAVTLERRHAGSADLIMALPRYLVTDRDRGSQFEALLTGRPAASRPAD